MKSLPQLVICIMLACTVAAVSRAEAEDLLPFGSNLFKGNFAVGSGAALQPGDRILVRIWGGGSTQENVLAVSPEGTLEIPGVGKATVAGLPRGDAEQIRQAIASRLKVAGKQDAEVYARPLDAQSITVFVTGFVSRPGSYAGASSDNILAFLDKAGGIDPEKGSYRSIGVKRGGKDIATADLYPFILSGEIPTLRFMDGDTIVVGERQPSVSASGEVRNAASFEFGSARPTGASLMSLADPGARATHASVSGWRQGSPFRQYLPLAEFSRLQLAGGDQVVFIADSRAGTIMVEAQGAVLGASRFPLPRGARLRDVLNFISVDPERADLAGIHLKRASTARQQKKSIIDALNRLEHDAYTATSSSNDEAQIRSREAEMLSSFIQRAREVEPEGIVVVGGSGETADIALEDGDVIVIPEKSDVVLISGEVLMPQAVVWSRKMDLEGYIERAGGFGNRADKNNILAVHPNGEVVSRPKSILPGDQILVLPRVDAKNMQALKEVSQILYQIAVAAKVILAL